MASPALADTGLRERAFVPVLVYMGMVVSIISSLGAPLIPSIAVDLHASLSSAQWALTATLLVGAVSTPIVGRLGDGRHRRLVTLLCLAIVAAGGALSALAGSLAVLIAGRAMQGVGLALMPLTMAAARDHLPDRRAPGAIALLSVVAAIGVGLGYPLTGFIAEHADLETAFWVGTAMTLVAFVAAAFVLPETSDAAHKGRLDLPGAIAIAVGLVCLLVACEKGPEWGWASTDTLGLLAVALVVLALFAVRELSTHDPLVDLRLVRHRVVLTANVVGGVLGVAMYIAIALMTQFAQLSTPNGFGLGESVFVAGVTLVPLSAGSFVASRFLPALQLRLGQRAVLAVGCLVVGAGMAFFAATADTLWQSLVAMGIVGLGLGLTFAALPGLIVTAIPRSETGSATGFYQVSRYVGFSIGSALSVTLVRAFGDPISGAYRLTFVVAAGICLLAAVIGWVLPGPTPRPGGPAVRRLEQEEGVVAAAGLELLEDRRPT
jgi:MFS family permease